MFVFSLFTVHVIEVKTTTFFLFMFQRFLFQKLKETNKIKMLLKRGKHLHAIAQLFRIQDLILLISKQGRQEFNTGTYSRVRITLKTNV